jgi:hypothetical protein
MPIDSLQTLDIIEAMENFLVKKRPHVHIRPKLDIGYKIEDQSIYIFEILPKWDNPEVIQEHNIAKTTCPLLVFSPTSLSPAMKKELRVPKYFPTCQVIFSSAFFPNQKPVFVC